MTPSTVLSSALVVVAAALLTRPASGSRYRLRVLRIDPAVPPRRRLRDIPLRLVARAERASLLTGLLTGLVAGLIGLALAGPVAALIVGGYAGAAAHVLLRVRAARRADRRRAAALAAVGALAADLRAGLAPGVALAEVWPRLAGDRVECTAGGPAPSGTLSPDATARGAAPVLDDPVPLLRAVTDPARAPLAGKLAAAWQLAQRTGAPLADVLDRLDAELRDRDRIRHRSAAQTAGARITTLLLAALPAVGLVLGQLIGARPLHVLLHTPIGAGCAAMAMGLQLAGLLWSARLSRVDPDRIPSGAGT